MRTTYDQVIEKLDLLAILCPFDPVVIGTPPLGIDVANSDIDIACFSEDLEQFANFATRQLESNSAFCIRSTIAQNHLALTVRFSAFDWDVEIFCQAVPTREQWGVRHFLIEQRLLALFDDLKSRVVELKRSGLKTEPAFAKALGLAGDPYVAILKLEDVDDGELLTMTKAK